MADDPQNHKHLRSFERYQNTVKPVSPRWLEYCISKRLFIDPTTDGYFIFKPFCITTPLRELLDYRFVVLGFNDVLKQRIYELPGVVALRPDQDFIANIRDLRTKLPSAGEDKPPLQRAAEQQAGNLPKYQSLPNLKVTRVERSPLIPMVLRMTTKDMLLASPRSAPPSTAYRIGP